jgi:hypothetical protein
MKAGMAVAWVAMFGLAVAADSCRSRAVGQEAGAGPQLRVREESPAETVAAAVPEPGDGGEDGREDAAGDGAPGSATVAGPPLADGTPVVVGRPAERPECANRWTAGHPQAAICGWAALNDGCPSREAVIEEELLAKNPDAEYEKLSGWCLGLARWSAGRNEEALPLLEAQRLNAPVVQGRRMFGDVAVMTAIAEIKGDAAAALEMLGEREAWREWSWGCRIVLGAARTLAAAGRTIEAWIVAKDVALGGACGNPYLAAEAGEVLARTGGPAPPPAGGEIGGGIGKQVADALAAVADGMSFDERGGDGSMERYDVVEHEVSWIAASGAGTIASVHYLVLFTLGGSCMRAPCPGGGSTRRCLAGDHVMLLPAGGGVFPSRIAFCTADSCSHAIEDGGPGQARGGQPEPDFPQLCRAWAGKEQPGALSLPESP